MPSESNNTFTKKLKNSFRRKKSEKIVLNRADSGQQPQENKPEYIKIVKSDNPCVNELLIESFIKYLSHTILENKLNEKNISKYKGFGLLAFVTNVFFGDDKKVKINVIDPKNHIMQFEFYVRGLQVKENSRINSDTIDGFVAGKKNSILQVYFSGKMQDSSLETASSLNLIPAPGSNDWATFRIECNEAIDGILKLSEKNIKDMVPERFYKFENAKVKLDEWVKAILAKKDILSQAAVKSKEYMKYKISLMKANPTTHLDLEKRYRKSQFFPIQPGKVIPTVNRVELAEVNNDTSAFNPG